LEVQPIRISFCIETLGHGKFTRESVLAREQLIVSVCRWDLSQSTMLDMLLLLLRSIGITEE
jgi:hypothetical protein